MASIQNPPPKKPIFPSLQLQTSIRQAWPSLSTILLFALFSLILYSEAFAFDGFGPEFASFYQINADISFAQVAHKYVELGNSWYRPTAFYTVYWLAAKFLTWHQILGWKLVNLLTLLATCYALYALTLLLFPRCRLGATLTCIYFVSHPGIYAPLFEISAFDFLHIFFTITCVLFFVAAHCVTPCSKTFCFLSVGSFILALTSKEITVVIPVYLIGAFMVLRFRTIRLHTLLQDLRRVLLSILPYFIILGFFIAFHIARIPSRPADSAYRTKANLTFILENLKKYPMWTLRIFDNTGDTLYQATEHAHLANSLFAVLLLILAVSQWSLGGQKRHKSISSFDVTLDCCLHDRPSLCWRLFVAQ